MLNYIGWIARKPVTNVIHRVRRRGTLNNSAASRQACSEKGKNSPPNDWDVMYPYEYLFKIALLMFIWLFHLYPSFAVIQVFTFKHKFTPLPATSLIHHFILIYLFIHFCRLRLLRTSLFRNRSLIRSWYVFLGRPHPTTPQLNLFHSWHIGVYTRC